MTGSLRKNVILRKRSIGQKNLGTSDIPFESSLRCTINASGTNMIRYSITVPIQETKAREITPGKEYLVATKHVGRPR